MSYIFCKNDHSGKRVSKIHLTSSTVLYVPNINRRVYVRNTHCYVSDV